MLWELVVGAILLAVNLVLCAHLIYPPLWRDMYTIYISTRMIRNTKDSCKNHELVVDRFEKQAKAYPNRHFIFFKDEVRTYGQVDRQATQVAKALLSLGVSVGDTVALVMTNEPPFVWIYLGVQKIGARIALINHHLVCEGLLHSLTGCAPKIVIVGDGTDTYLPGSVEAVRSELPAGLQVYSYNPPSSPAVGMPSFADLMTRVDADTDWTPPLAGDRGLRAVVKLTDPSAFIYTSGTTGFPKAAIVTHKKTIKHSHSYSSLGFSSRDVLYLALPLYHASALNLALLNVINVGATLALKDKFSVSSFWSDCVKYNVTTFQYIGEMCRYLVNAPKCAEERHHKLRAAVGNGLREDIWAKFQARFRVPHIFEFYGSTEFPANTINVFNVPGSVGRLSPVLSRMTSAVLVKIDQKTGKPFRNSRGRCFRVKPGESGVMLIQLSHKVSFDGYLGPASHTRDCLCQDVMEEGDFFVNTNDVFLMDQHYNLFFLERLGDSFRWKGENVSTADVSRAINHADFIQDTNVFGIAVPGCEGKAGMAAITLTDKEGMSEERLEDIEQTCKKYLPSYARPRFLRIQRQMSLTSTFKQEKITLIQEGFDPTLVSEPLYYLDRDSDHYKPLDQVAYLNIVEGKLPM